MYNELIDQLPYKSSFLFVDNISLLNKDEVVGDYTLRKDAFFYEDHFVGHPVTPGVIITEIMAQIGLVVLGIYLINQAAGGNSNKVAGGTAVKASTGFAVGEGEALFPLLTSTDVFFYKMVLPGEKVTVASRKQYFRFGKLKCAVEMRNGAGELVAKGVFAGFIKKLPI
jgi:3-hydroxyacyl-[acyl-carrier-protein] dehydratase